VDIPRYDRRVVPRWRQSLTTIATREVSNPGPASEPDAARYDFLATKLDALKRHRTTMFAADAVTSGLVLGRFAEVADAARQLIAAKDAPAPAKRLARIVLGIEQPAPGDEQIELLPAEPPASAIHRLRTLLRDEPRNALMWVDLARAYASTGLSQKADHSMSNALALAPNNRFTLRSASRLYVHTGNLERAHEVLRGSDALLSDPWLMAAEVAVATLRDVGPQSARRGRDLLRRSVLPPFHLAELRAAFGTLEILNGAQRRGRRLFKEALEDPTDNAVAQAEWASRQIGEFHLESKDLKTPRSFEARAWEASWQSKWAVALEQAKAWALDEPFSVDPGMLASFLAALVFEDYAESEALVRAALLANPTNVPLKNNLIYALANGGNLKEATQEYGAIDQNRLSAPERVFWLATGGLLEFRQGNLAGGRALYTAASESALAIGLARQGALAAGFLAREELLAGTADAKSAAATALPRLEIDPVVGQRILAPKIRALMSGIADPAGSRRE
jgi:Flp pilus assembly protein TadD